MTQMCFANPANRHQTIDTIIDGKGTYSGETLEEVRLRYPDVVVMSFDEAYKRYENSFAEQPPEEITEKEFWYFLEVLPPCSWTRQHDSESFYMSEFTCGDVTLHLVRIGTRYFKAQDHVMKNHADRVKKCLPLMEVTK